jgi:hypothetical protein
VSLIQIPKKHLKSFGHFGPFLAHDSEQKSDLQISGSGQLLQFGLKITAHLFLTQTIPS